MDPEIQAMSDVATALDALGSEDARYRVLRWAVDRYQVMVPSNGVAGGRDQLKRDRLDHSEHQGDVRRSAARDDPEFSDFVDLLDAVDPKSDVDKALTGAYWLQVVEKEPSWQSMRVNNLLKDTGHGVGNITTALNALQSRKPAFVRQMAKTGKSQQARKTYKLTTSGIAYVREKLGFGAAVPPALQDHGEDQ